MLAPGAKLAGCVVRDVARVETFTVTYAAEQLSARRLVWLRTLKTTVSARSVHADALEREARVLATLEHPAVIRLYAVERVDGVAALVLERVAGPTLAELITRGRLDPATGAAIARAIAGGLAHTHARGIVHAGVRPNRVVLADGGRPTIVDWSTALESVSKAREVDPPDTLVEPDWLAPEQLAGDVPDARADVYAVGAVAFALVAGRGPFAAPEAREVAKRIRTGDAPLLSAVVPDVPRGIERVVARALAADPRDRFDDAATLADAFAAAIAEHTSLSPESLIERIRPDGATRAAPPAPIPPRAPRDEGPSLRLALPPLLLLFALIVVGAIAIEGLRDDDERHAFGGDDVSATSPRDRALLRVVAHPWAEILVDGEHVETTPLARAIPLSPGRHYVTFRHPKAPDEQRPIRVVAGQTLSLEVTMRVDRGPPDAGRVDVSDPSSP